MTILSWLRHRIVQNVSFLMPSFFIFIFISTCKKIARTLIFSGRLVCFCVLFWCSYWCCEILNDYFLSFISFIFFHIILIIYLLKLIFGGEFLTVPELGQKKKLCSTVWASETKRSPETVSRGRWGPTILPSNCILEIRPWRAGQKEVCIVLI